MQALIDLIPVVLFVVAYQAYDIYIATMVLMASLVIQIALLKVFGRPVEKMHWITLGLVLFFGALTLGFRDPLFIMWKPTVINVLLAAALLASEWFMQTSLMTRMLRKMAPFPPHVCTTLTYLWAGFFVFLGLLNLYVAYNFSEETWVNFKLFGLMGLSLIFMVAQGFYLARHMPSTTLPNRKQ